MISRKEAKVLETHTHWDMETKAWVCSYCGAPPERLRIATGHDHTDYEIDFCTCRGVRP